MWVLDKILRRLVHSGQLTVITPDGRTSHFGEPKEGFSNLTLRLHDKSVGRSMALSPRLGVAEAYMDGRISIEQGDIMDFIALVRANNPWEQGKQIEPGDWSKQFWKSLKGRWQQVNHRRLSRANVSHHYDLSSKLYDQFLDPERQYSCAYWTPDTKTLEEAQQAKLAHIAAKLHLKPGMKVLDIGCGWGGMSLYLNRTYGVDVTGITLSTEQLAMANERAAREGVADKVRFELCDYRDAKGPYDRIVSVGMFEHVGVPNYREFFRVCHNLLSEEGVMLLHTIGRMGGPGSTDAFTQKYIFPGGYIPALSEIITASEPYRLMVTDVESLRIHYAKTLRAWYDRVQQNKPAIVALYDERFHRMWSFYLAGATAAFESGGMLNYQVQYSRSRHALPLTRDYIHEEERKIRA